MRERLGAGLDAANKLGITPARAGKTLKTLTGSPSCQDHPRSCGKDMVCYFLNTTKPGSPPLVRERLRPEFYNRVCEGITPARAGKTIEAILVIVKAEDHPRSCGKDASDMSRTILTMGSPPLVRERPAGTAQTESGSGITPARAGKTHICINQAVQRQDHPRSCGKDRR